MATHLFSFPICPRGLSGGMRNAEFGIRSDRLEYCSWRVETICTARWRNLRVEALDCSGIIEAIRTKRSRILPAGAPPQTNEHKFIYLFEGMNF